MAEPCPFIDLSGPPGARGQAYGSQAAARIRRGIGHYGAQLRALDLSPGQVGGLVRDYLPVTGALARSGLNASGVAITANYLESDRDYEGKAVSARACHRRVRAR